MGAGAWGLGARLCDFSDLDLEWGMPPYLEKGKLKKKNQCLANSYYSSKAKKPKNDNKS